MAKLKNMLLCFLVGVMLMAFSTESILVKANGNQSNPLQSLEDQISLLNPIVDDYVISQWGTILNDSIANGEMELKGNDYIYENTKVYRIENTSIISISVPISSLNHHNMSNLAVHFDEKPIR